MSKCIAWAVIFAWILTITISALWNWRDVDVSVMDLARIQANSHFDKDLVYRRWAAMHGGVYVPPTEKTPPNPYLSGLPERDIVTTTDKKLTLVNPAYMTRQVHELGAEQYGVKGHITSLKPIRPENSADAWETQALQRIEKGAEEVFSLETIDSQLFFRFMRPLIVEEPCLKCHAKQGYKVGDVRGGISVSVPFAPFNNIASNYHRTLLFGHIAIGLLGLYGLSIVSRRLRHSEKQRLRSLDEMSQMAEHNQLLLTSLGEGVYGTDLDGLCIFINPSALVMLGLCEDEVLGKDLHRLFHSHRESGIAYPREECPVFQTLQDGLMRKVEDSFIRKDGSCLPVHMHITPIRKKNSISGVIVSFSDITERRKDEEELQKYKDHLEEEVQQRTADLVHARNAAEAANKAKSEFLANMSHELRTPLNAILGFSNLMNKDQQLTEEQRQHLAIINRSGNHLLTLINDVLEMAKIEARQVTLQNEPFDLEGMIRDIVEMLEVRAKEKSVSLLLDQSSTFPRYINGDEAHLRQILINLVGNAVKFTERGEIVLCLNTKQNDTSHLLIEVEDSGPGIVEEDQKRIFEPFEQLGNQMQNKGTGLGLAITRQYVELMGGNIQLTSQLGKGTVFTVELPLQEANESEFCRPQATENAEVVGMEAGQPNYRILIVEDKKENQLLLAQLMENVGLQYKIAENGEKGVQLFRTWHPHLIFMDRRMPIMDGMDATRIIRQSAGNDSVKIIAVTASAFVEQRSEMLAAGMDDFVRKPYRFNEIYDCLARHLNLQFIYDNGVEPNLAVDGTLLLTTEMLAGLPEELRNDLKQALEILDSERIDQLILEVAEYDQKLQKTLASIAENFDYQTILKAL